MLLCGPDWTNLKYFSHYSLLVKLISVFVFTILKQKNNPYHNYHNTIILCYYVLCMNVKACFKEKRVKKNAMVTHYKWKVRLHATVPSVHLKKTKHGTIW